MSIETREHGQEHSQTQAQGSGNNHECSCAIGMQLCLSIVILCVTIPGTIICTHVDPSHTHKH